MEHRVPYRNDIILTAFLLALMAIIWLIAGAKSEPVKWVPVNDPQLVLSLGGICYFHNKPFTGVVFARYPNAGVALQAPYIEGKQEGWMRSWYADRTQQQERFFTDGKKQGKHRGWWPDGTLKFEYYFTDDEYNGAVKEWGVDGKPYRVFHYNMGHEDGLQQMWWPSGTIRANYVVKDGQQYGLIGRKLCRNVYK